MLEQHRPLQITEVNFYHQKEVIQGGITEVGKGLFRTKKQRDVLYSHCFIPIAVQQRRWLSFLSPPVPFPGKAFLEPWIMTLTAKLSPVQSPGQGKGQAKGCRGQSEMLPITHTKTNSGHVCKTPSIAAPFDPPLGED